MQLRDMSVMICGQRFTSRTETLENYFNYQAARVGVIAMAGVRQRQNSTCRLYENGKVTKEFDMPGFHLSGESIAFTLMVGLYYLRFARNFFAAQKKLGRFDLFVGVQTWATLLGIFLKKMGRVDRVIYYCIDYYKPTARAGSKIETFVFRHLDRYCCRNADMIWDLTPNFKDYRKEYFPHDDYSGKNIYVPLTYSQQLLMNRRLEEIERHSLAFVGTLEGEQGWDVFIRAIPHVKKAFPDFKVHIYGDGSYRPKIEELIEEVGVGQDVVMHGFIKGEAQLLSELSRCAVGIAPYLPHKAEYTGLESGKPKLYALVGLPIIMTHTEFIESQFAKFKTGMTFKYDPESLAQTIVQILKDDGRLMEFKKSANDFARRFTSEAVFPEALEKTFAVMGKSSF